MYERFYLIRFCFLFSNDELESVALSCRISGQFFCLINAGYRYTFPFFFFFVFFKTYTSLKFSVKRERKGKED